VNCIDKSDTVLANGRLLHFHLYVILPFPLVHERFPNRQEGSHAALTSGNVRVIVEIAKGAGAERKYGADFAIDDFGGGSVPSVVCLFAYREGIGCFGLFNTGYLVAGADELIRHGSVGYFRKAGVGDVSLHVEQSADLDAHVGVSVEHFVEFSGFEEEDGIGVAGFEVPPLLDGVGHVSARDVEPVSGIDLECPTVVVRVVLSASLGVAGILEKW
jgi:hypothetical protein